ncbi:sugar phosphate isomerase/epimerase family protein [Paenibacillus piri]|uniref:Sugar phosphate isomerase/epimerase n=1 Tax=Paenibacillus piri TaxID=2547395 RepID=A0A4R5KSN0_9BACL|nr:TIM barrel protein [Paenibacillus piri]TDF98058.1 sugar phosphate isomerase/epimerase [Paenibacillus piri]
MSQKKRIAVQTQLWGNANLDQDFVPIYDQAMEAGYDGVESRFTVMKQKEKLRKYLDEKPLRIFALHTSPETFYNQGIKAEFGELLQDMKQFDIGHLLFSPAKRESMKEQREWLHIIEQMGERCAEQGIQLSYHNHAWEFERYGYELFDAIAEHEHIGIALDIGWLYRSGYDLNKTVERYQRQIKYLHIKDTTKENWRELGTGDVGIGEAVKLLDTLGLDLWTIEQDTSELPPLTSARISRDYLSKLEA